MAITDKNKSTIDRLKELQTLYEKGILTRKEMESEKMEILGSIDKANTENENSKEMPQTIKTSANNANITISPNKSNNIQAKSHINKKSTKKMSHLSIIYAIVFVVIILIILLISNKSCSNSTADESSFDEISTADTAAYKSVSSEKIPPIQEIMENTKVTNMTITNFFAVSEISKAIQDKYGKDFYSFIIKKISPYKDKYIDIEKSTDRYDYTSYSFTFYLFKEDDNSFIYFNYDAWRDAIDVTLSLAGGNVNADGTYALRDGTKWKLGHESDEFDDPIEDKALIYVEGETDYVSCELHMAVLQNNHNQILFFYELPWSDAHDYHRMKSIKIKNKNDGTVYNIKKCTYYKDHCILSEEDSRYIIDLCDSNPDVSFSVRFDINNYDLFIENETSYAIFDFDNGRAYGLSNAINHYFKRAF